MKIVLARHGRPSLGQRRWITSRQLADWIRAYDEGGVFVEDVPPQIQATAARSGWIITSPLLRCLQSAQALAPLRRMDSEEDFREAGLPYAPWGLLRLPPSVWSALFRAAWFLGYSTNSESLAMARSRGRKGATRLIELAREHQSVLLVGHGIMNALIAEELIIEGWEGPKRRAHGCWQFNVYQAEP